MSVLQIAGMVLALVIGIYAGLGFPGLPGRQDRVLKHRSRRAVRTMPLDWLRPRKR